MDIHTAKKLVPSIQALYNSIQKQRGLDTTDVILQNDTFLVSLLAIMSQKTDVILEDVVSDLTNIPINVVFDTWAESYRRSDLVRNIRKTMYCLEHVGLIKVTRKPVGMYGIKFTWNVDLPKFEKLCQHYGIAY